MCRLTTSTNGDLVINKEPISGADTGFQKAGGGGEGSTGYCYVLKRGEFEQTCATVSPLYFSGSPK